MTSTHFSIDQCLNDGDLGGSMHLLYFAGQRMTNAWIKPNKITFCPFHFVVHAHVTRAFSIQTFLLYCFLCSFTLLLSISNEIASIFASCL